ncbi:MAG: CRISPR-associated protein Cas4 [Candidatus Goldbacteria bacterium]|nr:CRISPR-associated protein Cas4 [Candidatus Goldiibacteriota bacterium]
MNYKEEDLLALSGLQHYFYCKRQWALIEVERQWVENFFTAEGRLLHDRVDNKCIEHKEGVIIERSVSLKSEKLGIYGVADVVEFHKSESGIKLQNQEGLWMPKPIEYKRGMPKENICDRAQLCCQAMCLEELFGVKIENGYLFYWQTRRRVPVIFDEGLRTAVINACADMHDMINNGITPEVPEKAKCKNCSLFNVCIPEVRKNKSGKVEKYIDDNIHWFNEHA